MSMLAHLRRTGVTWGSLLACCATFAWPTHALPATSAEFTTRGTHGYRVSIHGSGQGVALSASGPAGTATYRVPGRVTAHRLAANFGRRGRVNVTFKPTGPSLVRTPARRCKGRPKETRAGIFSGVIRFSGERGFTRVSTRRARGAMMINPRWRCRKTGAEESTLRSSTLPEPGVRTSEAVVLELTDARRRLAVEAVAAPLDIEFGPPITPRLAGVDAGLENPLLISFKAAMHERRGRMTIERDLDEAGDELDFAYDESLREASLSPPFPFAGTGHFGRTGAGGSWTGSLSLALPGTARIPLTEPRFQARLYREE